LSRWKVIQSEAATAIGLPVVPAETPADREVCGESAVVAVPPRLEQAESRATSVPATAVIVTLVERLRIRPVSQRGRPGARGNITP
jgi:hypothetical protein